MPMKVHLIYTPRIGQLSALSATVSVRELLGPRFLD